MNKQWISAFICLLFTAVMTNNGPNAETPRARKPETPRIREPEISVGDRRHWAFKPIQRPTLPRLKSHEAEHPIDRFILARLEKANLEPLPPANRVTLIRRLYLVLIGLPPTMNQVQEFVNDNAPDAYERLVDRLLAGPEYGERWGQHWLDLARFAETDGFEHDHVRKEAWRYRDWVIDALNRDVPYDDFVRLQIAGDEIKPNKSGTHLATGFLVSGPDMPDINLLSERTHVVLNEMTSTVGSVFMALTLECAQCHDHKFDPISQADFYRFRALLVGTVQGLKRNKQLPTAIREHGPKAGAAHLMIRGDFRRPGPTVEPAFVRIANKNEHHVKKPGSSSKSSMRRRALAEWLTSRDHPLTSRVIVNRLWQHHFGQGLALTPGDFGVMGGEPSHPELIDWLSTELIRNDWSMKQLHRLIVTSDVWKRAASPSDPTWSEDLNKEARQRWTVAKKRDSENRLLARRLPIRLEGEVIRDAMLKSANELISDRGGPGVRPPLPKELVETLLKNQWKVSPDKSDHHRRSIYIFARRNLRYPIFDAFDRPDANAPCSRRTTSTTAPQALMLLNSSFSHEISESVASSIIETTKDETSQVRLCFERILSRQPTKEELTVGRAFLKDQEGRIQKDDPTAKATMLRKTALADFCLALFNLNEFIYIE